MISKILSKNTFSLIGRSKFAFGSIQIELPHYDTHRLDSYEFPQHSYTNKEELMKVFTDMTLMRRMETACDQLYKERHIRGFCHLYDGQEAVIQGIEDALTLEDMMITAYRCHCHALKRGHNVHQIIAEMLGKVTGGSKGKGGSMHYYDEKANFYGGNGIVGAQIPVGAGLAFTQKYKKTDNIAVTMYGDGAANQGQLFEAANMAYLWKLPLIFICENNKYAMGTPVERHASNSKFYVRGDNIPGVLVNGNNYFHVLEIMKFAKKYAVEQGPLFIEIESYRYHGHSMSDPGLSYRTREEVQEHRKNKDCINYIKSIILDNNLASPSDLKAIEKQAKQEVDQAVKQAKNDPFPTVEDQLYADTYKQNDQHFLRGIEYQSSHFPKSQL